MNPALTPDDILDENQKTGDQRGGVASMLESLTEATFSEQLNTTFRIRIGDPGSVDVELTEVSAGRQTPRQEQFSIVFRGPLDAPFGQGMYSLEHEKIGSFDLFLVPVGKDDKGFYYQAVFNRLRK